MLLWTPLNTSNSEVIQYAWFTIVFFFFSSPCMSPLLNRLLCHSSLHTKSSWRLTPTLPRLELGSLYCAARARSISVWRLSSSRCRHEFLDREKENHIHHFSNYHQRLAFNVDHFVTRLFDLHIITNDRCYLHFLLSPLFEIRCLCNKEKLNISSIHVSTLITIHFLFVVSLITTHIWFNHANYNYLT